MSGNVLSLGTLSLVIFCRLGIKNDTAQVGLGLGTPPV